MTSYTPAKIFAAINTISNQPQKPIEVPALVEDVPPKRTPPTRANEIQVSATGELSLPPDRCRMAVTVGSKKDDAQEAKNSVVRRLDYILQVLNNHQIKEGDINVCKVLKRIDNIFHFDAEVTITFCDFNKCQSIANFLVEKLDSSVLVSHPEFFQSPQRLETLRRQASIAAVKNSKLKAAEIAQFLNARVGQPISIREEYCNETEGVQGGQDLDGPITIQNRMTLATVNVSVKVSASYELKPKGKSKNQTETKY